MRTGGAAKSAGAADAVTLCFGVVPHWLRPSLLVVLAAALTPCHARAQEKPKPPAGKCPRSYRRRKKPEHVPTLADYPQEPLVYESVRSVMRYENDGTGSIDIQVRMRAQIARGSGARRATDFLLQLRKPTRTNCARSSHQARRPEVTAGPEAHAGSERPVAQEAPMYSDVRQIHVTVPGIDVGDELEYHR